MNPSGIAHIAESIELRMNEAFWALRPGSTADGQKLFRLGGALVTVKPKSISLQRNRVVGLGVDEPATEPMIDEALDIFRDHKVKRFSLHQGPCGPSDAMVGWLEKRGFRPHHAYSKLVRETRDAPQVRSDLRVRRIGQADSAAFAAVFGHVFAAPPSQRDWITASVGAPGFSHYLAFAGDQPVATGMVYVQGDGAWMGWGATLTPFRRRGAQGAIIAARVKRAADLGAKWIVSETLEPRRGRPSGSYRNLLEHGFQQAYLRPIWAWERCPEVRK
jgi:hypothetical protein